MCLAVPMRIEKMKDDGMAEVSVMGAVRDVALDLTPQAQVGDYVLVHAGFAIIPGLLDINTTSMRGRH